ncbi:T9SS type A sorting domain-containing protein [Carboxylicivirga marina]|uniref:T9SS type A sorting domain-containing protein n=1 Tax=Carboxylicivirga marina TaxID=2800988 RepID=UPI0025984756|nr:T9SS type A sorting domain-containing protein [uncultured Carboxylicivirga sp.]
MTGPEIEGEYVLKVVVNDSGLSGGQSLSNIILRNDNYKFSDYYNIPAGEATTRFSWNVLKTSTTDQTENDHAVKIFALSPDIDAETEVSKSQGEKLVGEDWNYFDTPNGKVYNENGANEFDQNNVTMRYEIHIGYVGGTYYVDNLTSSIDNATSIPTSIGNIKNNDIKIWSSNRAVKIMNKAGKTGLAAVYDLSGRQLKQVQLSTDENTIEMQQGGLYIVKSTIDGHVLTQKVVLK